MKARTLMVSLLMMTTFAGCLGNEEVSGDEDAVLRVITYDSFGISEEMLSAFTNETGFEVELTRAGDAGTVLATSLQTRDSNLYDLALGIDNSYLGSALAADLFQPLDVDRGGLSARALVSYDGYLAIPYDVGSICLNYDGTYVDGENVTVPESLWDFTSENWTGKVAVQNPRTSSPGRAFLIATATHLGEDYDDWWAAMNANDVIVSDGWTEAYEVHYSAGYGVWNDGFIGDAKAVVSYCHSPGVEAYFGDNWTNSVALDIPGASFGQIEYAALLAGSKNGEAAKAFVEWLISEDINAQMPTLNYMYPAIEGGELPEDAGYRWHSVVPTDAVVSPETIEGNIADWLDTWDTSMA
jgi:thiamine transport system substrate-binding protein